MRSLRIVVAGCGRLGSRLASSLSHDGHEVVVVDDTGAALDRLRGRAFQGQQVQGDATEVSVLRRAGIERADLLIAATREDNVNLMVAVVAKRLFGVSEVIARVSEPEREAVYRDLGLTPICPTVLGVEAILGLVSRYLGAPGSGSGEKPVPDSA